MCLELSPHGDAICDLDGYVHCFADVGEESGSHSDNLPGTGAGKERGSEHRWSDFSLSS